MKVIRLLILAALLLLGATPATAQVELPPAAREVLDQLEQESAGLEKNVEANLKKRQDQTAAALKEAQDQLCRQGKLDEAAAVRTLARAIQEGTRDARPLASQDSTAAELLRRFLDAVLDEAGSGLPPVALDIRRQHDKEVADLYAEAATKLQKHRDRAIAELEKVKEQYCKDAKLDEALAVRDMIRQTRSGRPAIKALPDPGTLVGHRGNVGKSFYFEVTGSNTGSVWGADIYTDDSSLATAAVHAGVLGVGQKGVIKVTILAG